MAETRKPSTSTLPDLVRCEAAHRGIDLHTLLLATLRAIDQQELQAEPQANFGPENPHFLPRWRGLIGQAIAANERAETPEMFRWMRGINLLTEEYLAWIDTAFPRLGKPRASDKEVQVAVQA